MKLNAAYLLTILPIIYLLGFEVGFLYQKLYPGAVAISAVYLSLMTALALFLVQIKKNDKEQWDKQQQISLMIVIGLFAWPVAVQLISALQCGLSRVGDFSLFACVIVVLLANQKKCRSFLPNMGVAMACATIVAVSVSVYHGKTSIGSGVTFGFGWFTVLGCLATPVLLGWSYVLWKERRESGKYKELLLCVLAVSALIAYCIMTERRGPLLGAIGGTICWFALYAYGRFPRVTVAMGTVIVLVILSVIINKIVYDAGYGRSERFLLYRFAWETGLSGLPFGHGPYGLLAADQAQGFSSFLWLARDKVALHAHNELLNAWVEGGPVQVLLVLGLLGCLMARIINCSDQVLRTAYAGVIGAWCVHAMTDNTFGTPLGMVWTGVIFGSVLALPQKNREVKEMPRAVLWLGVVFGVLTLSINYYNFSLATISEKTTAHERSLILQKNRDPVFVLGDVGAVVSDSAIEPELKVMALETGVNRIGWAGNFRQMAAMTSAESGNKRQYIHFFIEMTKRNPFNFAAALEVAQTVHKWPEFMFMVPDELKQRVAILSNLRDPNPLTDVRDPLQASQHLAAIYAKNFSGVKLSTEQQEIAKIIIMQYGRISQVAMIALQLCSTLEDGFTDYMVSHLQQIHEGCTEMAIQRGFSLIKTKSQAEKMMPMLIAMCPAWIKDLEEGNAPHFDGLGSEAQPLVWSHVVAVWAMSRR